MSRRLILVLALLFVAGMTCAAYAEVQNVKVSGDFLASGVARSHFNLTSGSAGDKENTQQSLMMSQVRVRIDADLTDNVGATVRLINERVWNGQNDSSNGNIDLDLAYVTLKEFLYSPLTLTVGRQEMRFGNGLVIGNAKVASGVVGIPTDLTERKAFDAVRATLDYDPLVVDLVYAKVKQSSTMRNNDISLAGVNASYALNKKVNASLYYFLKRDNDGGDEHSRTKADKVNTIGALVSATPIENLKASVEGAYQFGKNTANAEATQQEHEAWALQAMADYTFAKVKMTPNIGASYTYLSGNKRDSSTKNKAWDSMFYDQALNNITFALLPFSNMSVFNLKASLKPMEDVTLAVNYGYYDLAKKLDADDDLHSPSLYNGSTKYLDSTYQKGKRHLGDAIDVTATYDYTEDVQLGLTAGWFSPGKAIAANNRSASQLIGSMKVTF
jgi:hypothetical protein